MRLGVALAGVFAVIVSTYFVVSLLSPRPFSEGPIYKLQNPEEGAPEVALSGPQPKAVIDETEYDFGRMEVGEEREHVFMIRNEGEAPLKIKKGKTTCQCTVSDVETGELAVGASAKITLKWKPTVQAEQFGKGAAILTNDPENKVISLKILGMVAPRLITYPSNNWDVPEILNDEPTVFSGQVVSPVMDKFQIVALECKSPFVSAESLPADPEKLKVHNGLSGFQIRVSISPELPLGAFAIPLTIKTDVPERTSDGKLGSEMSVEVLISGRRRGPFRIVGRAWDEDQMVMMLGTFNAIDGKKLTLPVFVRGTPQEGLKFTEPPQCDPPALQATLAPDEKATGKHARYLLTLEYPAGSPRVTFLKDHPASVRLHTNHPGAREVDLQVYFSAN